MISTTQYHPDVRVFFKLDLSIQYNLHQNLNEEWAFGPAVKTLVKMSESYINQSSRFEFCHSFAASCWCGRWAAGGNDSSHRVFPSTWKIWIEFLISGFFLTQSQPCWALRKWNRRFSSPSPPILSPYPSKISSRELFCRYWWANSTVYMERQMSQPIPDGEEQRWRSGTPQSWIYYKVTVIKTVKLTKE